MDFQSHRRPLPALINVDVQPVLKDLGGFCPIASARRPAFDLRPQTSIREFLSLQVFLVLFQNRSAEIGNPVVLEDREAAGERTVCLVLGTPMANGTFRLAPLRTSPAASFSRRA